MAQSNQAGGAVAVKPIDEIRLNLERLAPQFKMVLGNSIQVERFVRIVVTAVQNNVDLSNCERATLYSAAMKAAEDGLLPDGREAIIVAYNANVGTRDNPKWVKHAQYQPMIRGMIRKVRESELVVDIKVHVVKKNDRFVYELGDEERIVHVPPSLGEDRGETIGAYSIVLLKSGEKSHEVMSRAEIESIRQRSKSKDKDGNPTGPWKTDYDEMCRKTVFRRHEKRLPRSAAMDKVIQNDNAAFGLDEDELTPISTQRQEPGVSAAPTSRPAALEKVAQAGGEPIEGQVVRQQEPVEARQQQGGGAQRPDDVI